MASIGLTVLLSHVDNLAHISSVPYTVCSALLSDMVGPQIWSLQIEFNHEEFVGSRWW